ncbi:MAG: hypothetical protein QM817_05355 [Archangium sp.]
MKRASVWTSAVLTLVASFGGYLFLAQLTQWYGRGFLSRLGMSLPVPTRLVILASDRVFSIPALLAILAGPAVCALGIAMLKKSERAAMVVLFLAPLVPLSIGASSIAALLVPASRFVP